MSLPTKGPEELDGVHEGNDDLRGRRVTTDDDAEKDSEATAS